MVESMELFNSHLLIPTQPGYIPSPQQVIQFIKELFHFGAAPTDLSIRLRTLSGETSYARNPSTGEKIPLQRWTEPRLLKFEAISPAIEGVNDFVLTLSGEGPLPLPPFELYRRDGSGLALSDPYSCSVKFAVRSKPTQLSESWHEHCRTFLLPPEFAADACPHCGAIHSGEDEVQPKFWIEFGFEGAGLPSFKASPEPIHPQILASAEQIFDVSFIHGRFFN
jgi:hypothetical protein